MSAVSRLVAKARLKLWSLANWRKGYRFGPVQRYRCCGHTTPTHASNCLTRIRPGDLS
jgi:hypothetical protein